jgi:hypothetical protein
MSEQIRRVREACATIRRAADGLVFSVRAGYGIRD